MNDRNRDPIEPLLPNPHFQDFQQLNPNDLKINVTEYQIEPDQLDLKKYPLLDEKATILMNSYTQTIQEFMLAMIGAGYCYDDIPSLAKTAKDMTDALIAEAKEEK